MGAQPQPKSIGREDEEVAAILHAAAKWHLRSVAAQGLEFLKRQGNEDSPLCHQDLFSVLDSAFYAAVMQIVADALLQTPRQELSVLLAEVAEACTEELAEQIDATLDYQDLLSIGDLIAAQMQRKFADAPNMLTRAEIAEQLRSCAWNATGALANAAAPINNSDDEIDELCSLICHVVVYPYCILLAAEHFAPEIVNDRTEGEMLEALDAVSSLAPVPRALWYPFYSGTGVNSSVALGRQRNLVAELCHNVRRSLAFTI